MLSARSVLKCCIAMLAVAALAGSAQASVTINWVTVDGGATVEVAPGASVTVAMNVTIVGGGFDDWDSSRWQIEGGSWTCENTSNHGSGTNTESFSISAPATPGVYDLNVRAYEKNDCKDDYASFTLTDAITVCEDNDSDGICNADDACPEDPDNDIDGDLICGDVDICPNDPDNDIDGDGICGDVDICPNDPDDDADGDGLCADVDNCPTVSNPGQEDTGDSDGVGDVCDCDPDIIPPEIWPTGMWPINSTEYDGMPIADLDLSTLVGTSDFCGSVTLAVTAVDGNPPGTKIPLGFHMVEITATDGSGNSTAIPVPVLVVQGVPSPSGDPGPQGDPGDPGDPGPAGPSGPSGSQGTPGQDGCPCWDLNCNGTGDADEDVNGDGNYDTLDCQGPAGQTGPQGPQGQEGAQGTPGEQGEQGATGAPAPTAPGCALFGAVELTLTMAGLMCLSLLPRRRYGR